MGDRAGYCAWALKALQEKEGFHLRRWSSVYLTEPVGFVSKNWFYNLVVELETAYSPWEVLLVLLTIELQAGRRRTGALADRTLDLDLLLYGDLILETDFLALPHPALDKRRFVLTPLTELIPSGKHPITKESFQNLLARLPQRPEVKKLSINLK